MEVSVTSRRSGDRTVVRVVGEIDVYTAPALREELAAQQEDGPVHLVVDLTEVPFMDSTGLGVLVGSLKKVRLLGGRLQLVISTERVEQLFRITALLPVFTGLAGWGYGIVAFVAGVAYLVYAIAGVRRLKETSSAADGVPGADPGGKRWARRLMLASVAWLAVIFAALMVGAQ